ncbi:hypothetical protein GJ496_003810 [Pomphorhynchus laevis]|nr:hypothetical protein GJ496_003810 [Pomphorhynchus laevis]
MDSAAMRTLRDGEIEHPVLDTNELCDGITIREKLELLHPSPVSQNLMDMILHYPLPEVIEHQDVIFAHIGPAKTASMCLRRPIREPLSTYHRTENTNEHVDQYQLARGQAQLRQKEVVHQVETLEWTGDGDDN